MNCHPDTFKEGNTLMNRSLKVQSIIPLDNPNASFKTISYAQEHKEDNRLDENMDDMFDED